MNINELLQDIREAKNKLNEIEQSLLIHFKIQAQNEFVVDNDLKHVYIRGKALLLPHIEFEIVNYLYQNQNIHLTKEQIYRHVFQDVAEWDSKLMQNSHNVIAVHIHRIRKKLKKITTKKYIHTRHGIGGYYFKE